MNSSLLKNDLLAKVSWRLIPLLFLSYICAYLDRINIGFASKSLKAELDFLKEPNLKDSSKQKIIQCDKCYNEYAAENIQTSYFIQHIRQQYCNECFEKINKQHHIKKSKSDSHFRYIK